MWLSAVWIVVGFSLGLACACQSKTQVEAPEGAAGAASAFLTAVQKDDCELAWSYLSAGTQRYVEVKSAEMIRREPYYAEPFAPKNLYCKPTSVHRFRSYVAESARVKLEKGTRAIVQLEKRESAGYLLPGFWPTRTELATVEMELVEEAGAWKIVLP